MSPHFRVNIADTLAAFHRKDEQRREDSQLWVLWGLGEALKWINFQTFSFYSRFKWLVKRRLIVVSVLHQIRYSELRMRFTIERSARRVVSERNRAECTAKHWSPLPVRSHWMAIIFHRKTNGNNNHNLWYIFPAIDRLFVSMSGRSLSLTQLFEL